MTKIPLASEQNQTKNGDKLSEGEEVLDRLIAMISGALNRKNRPMNLDWPAAGQKFNSLCAVLSFELHCLKNFHAHVLTHITWILSTIKEWIVYSDLNWQSDAVSD